MFIGMLFHLFLFCWVFDLRCFMLFLLSYISRRLLRLSNYRFQLLQFHHLILQILKLHCIPLLYFSLHFFLLRAFIFLLNLWGILFYLIIFWVLNLKSLEFLLFTWDQKLQLSIFWKRLYVFLLELLSLGIFSFLCFLNFILLQFLIFSINFFFLLLPNFNLLNLMDLNSFIILQRIIIPFYIFTFIHLVIRQIKLFEMLSWQLRHLILTQNTVLIEFWLMDLVQGLLYFYVYHRSILLDCPLWLGSISLE